MTETELYTKEHSLVDNGVGDFDLMCGEKKACFVPYFSRHGIKQCPLCQQVIERKE